MVVTDTEPERLVPLPRQRDGDLLNGGSTMNQQSSLSQSAQSVRQMLTDYRLASGEHAATAQLHTEVNYWIPVTTLCAVLLPLSSRSFARTHSSEIKHDR
jgi:hypothetical protein